MKQNKKLIIIGAVAGGTTAGTQARRNDSNLEITIYEKDKDISYSGCGLPYYIGGIIKDRKEIVPRDNEYFKEKYNIDIKTQHEVLVIDSINKKVLIKNLINNEIFEDTYDNLVISTGAVPFVPNKQWLGKENVFTLRNVSSGDKILDYINTNKPKSAVIIGTGFIGLELCENLCKRNIEVILVELKDQIMPPLDKDMADLLEEYIIANGVKVYKDETVLELKGDNEIKEVVTNKRTLETDMVILSIGIRPNTELAEKAGVELGKTKAIKVNEKMQTNINNIYAVGDCAEVFSIIHKDYVYRPLGSTANKMGRIAGKNITGENKLFKGILSTGIFKMFDKTVAFLGMNENELEHGGIKRKILKVKTFNKPSYMEGATKMDIKLICEENSDRILGVQIIGGEGVDKAIDTFAAIVSLGGTGKDLANIDLAYSPPYSTVNSPVIQCGIVAEGNLNN